MLENSGGMPEFVTPESLTDALSSEKAPQPQPESLTLPETPNSPAPFTPISPETGKPAPANLAAVLSQLQSSPEALQALQQHIAETVSNTADEVSDNKLGEKATMQELLTRLEGFEHESQQPELPPELQEALQQDKAAAMMEAQRSEKEKPNEKSKLMKLLGPLAVAAMAIGGIFMGAKALNKQYG